jgi:hypothetical protein
MKRYHEDQQLFTLLSKSSPSDYRKHVSQELEKLETQLDAASLARTPEALSAFQELKTRSQNLQPVQFHCVIVVLSSGGM